MKPTIWPNHRSDPIWGSRDYNWALWIEGDEDVRRTIARVKYILHPTFEKGELETADAASSFRIDGTGWGSFYVRVVVYYFGGFSEEISYFLDVKQFFERKGPPKMKKCSKNHVDDKELLQLYHDGYRDFSRISVVQESQEGLSRSALTAANFQESKLDGLSMVGADLMMCNFQGADLSGTNLSGADLTRARLTSANMSGAILYGINKTDWLIDDVKATHVFLGTRGERRVPLGRDFGEEELAMWLKSLRDLDSLIPPNSPTVFISYSWKDEESVLAVDQWLRNHGINVLIDKRDFPAGFNLYDEMTQKISTADKVEVFYSKNSKDRPYTTLERRMAQQREASYRGKGVHKVLLIYLQLDDEDLPAEVSHRLAIRAKGQSFKDVCEKLLDAILEQKSTSPTVDIPRYDQRPPW